MKQVLLALLLTASLVSCKKEEDPELQGKWTVNNIVYKEYMNNSLANTDTFPGSGETIEFQSNGTVVISAPGQTPESYTYTQSGNTVTFDGDTFEVRDLGENNVTLFIRDDWAPGEYDETYINLTR